MSIYLGSCKLCRIGKLFKYSHVYSLRDLQKALFQEYTALFSALHSCMGQSIEIGVSRIRGWYQIVICSDAHVHDGEQCMCKGT